MEIPILDGQLGLQCLQERMLLALFQEEPFNPAVALGITVLNLSTWSNIWVFILANLAVAAQPLWWWNPCTREKN